MDSILQRILRGGLISLFALVPLAIFYRTYPPMQVKDLLMVGVVAFAALGWLWISMAEQRSEIRADGLKAILAFNLLVWGLSLLLSPHPNEGLAVICVRLAGVGLVLLIPFHLRQRRDLALVLALLLGTAAIMALYGLLQFFKLDPFLKSEGLVGHFRVCSTTNHPNIFISLLVACVPLNLAGFVFFSGRPRARLLLGLTLLLSLGAAVATLSRAGLGALALAVVVTMIGLWRSGQAGSGEGSSKEGGGAAWAKVVIPVVLLLGALIAFGVGRGTMDPGERERLLSLRGPTTQKRLLIYKAALQMASEAPVTGKGLGTFSLFLPAHRSAELARFFPRNEYHVEHGVSEPLEVLAESGGLGLLGWILLVGVFVIRPLRAMRHVGDPGLRALMVASAAGVLGLAAHGFVEVSLRFQPPLFLFWALPGIALAAEAVGRREQPTGRTIALSGWGGRLGVSVVVGMVFGLALAMMLSDFVAAYHVGNGRRALKAGDLKTAEQDFRRAEQAWSGNLPGRYRRAGVLWKLGRLEEAEAEYREVLRQSPYYFDANHNLARVLHGRGKYAEAGKLAAVATRINAYHVPSHELAVRLALRLRKVAEAQRLAQHIRKVAAEDLRTRTILARVRLFQGRRAEARALLGEVLAKEPGNEVARRLMNQVEQR